MRISDWSSDVCSSDLSADEAQALVDELNVLRPDSAMLQLADLADSATLAPLADAAHARWRRLDALVNNASSYFATAFGTIDDAQLDDLLASNLRAPLLRSDEHPSELQYIMRNSTAVFCFTKK